MWDVEFTDEFRSWWNTLSETEQEQITVRVERLQQGGPGLGRPLVETITTSRHANMKELRFDAADGVWRVAFAFDPKREAVLLVAGDKSGTGTRQFYKRLLKAADERFDEHLLRQKETKT